MEGTEKICVRYQAIVSTTKAKTYDILDPRKLQVTLYKACKMPFYYENVLKIASGFLNRVAVCFTEKERIEWKQFDQKQKQEKSNK